MPQSNLSFEQRNLHGPVTSTPKNCIHQVLITYTGCHHVIIYSTHNSKRQDGYGFIGENGYIFHESSRCIEVPIGGAYAHMFEDLLQVITTVWLLGGMRGCHRHAWLPGACMVARGHASLWGACVVVWGVCGCQGVCVVARGCVWLLGGMHGCQRGHVWLPGGMCGCQGFMPGCGGACVVAWGHVWLQGHAWWPGGGHAWDTVNERVVRILLECILVFI